ncbi:unnamed protein product [Pseudo-nitzschia multistriata]|uniref:Helicase-associated domain-containing protein n=1 Tax=Pseudo-nitzschia multistriata TaxID=183589 RepID=A0A448YY68_9STRA|nr:unnamed protein product [Pseudo-nitzschia multistriata]
MLYRLVIPSDLSDFLVIALAATSSLLAMMSIALSPWIIYATRSSDQESFLKPSCSKQPAIPKNSLDTGNREDRVLCAGQVDDGNKIESNETISCVERKIHQIPMPRDAIYKEEELRLPTSLFRTTSSTSNKTDRSISPVPTTVSATEAPHVVTPKPYPLATNVIFREATLSIETSRKLKRKVSHDISYCPESDDGCINRKGSSSDLQPKRKKLESPTSNKSLKLKSLRSKKSSKLKSPRSNKKKVLSDRRFRRMAKEKAQKKKMKKNPSTKNWMDMYKQLATFKEQNNGSIVVPWSNNDADLQQLGYWIRDQKRKLRTNKLSKNHADLLQSIGMV